MRRPVIILAIAVITVTVAAIVALVIVGRDDPGTVSPPSPKTPPPTLKSLESLAGVDTLTTAVSREAFCDDVASEAVESALGGEPVETTSYVDGEKAPLVGEVHDISHEFGCAWTTPTAAARAWVFAPPVTTRAAARLVEAARDGAGCRPLAGAPAFGEPSIALTCPTSRGVQASFRGLFGDAWLTCTVTADLPAADVAERADRWCVAVLTALAN